MKRNIVTALLIVLFFILQSTLFQALSLGGISANILIILTVSYGFIRGKKNGLLVGFFCGLFVDLFFGSVIGFYAIIYMYIGYTNGLLHETFFKEDIKLPLLLIAVSDSIYNMIIYILLFLLRGRFQFGYYFLHIILPEMVYTVVITIALYPLLFFLNKKFDEIEKRRAKKFV